MRVRLVDGVDHQPQVGASSARGGAGWGERSGLVLLDNIPWQVYWFLGWRLIDVTESGTSDTIEQESGRSD